MKHPPIGLYIHVPFCWKLCPYCHFYKQRWSQDGEAQFIHAILKEMDLYADHPPEIGSIFFGGGTPSTLSPASFSRLLEGVYRCFRLTPPKEITVEVNPEHISPALIKVFTSFGVNRISLGTQSFIDEELAALGRLHRTSSAKKTIASLKDAGLVNINFDLIFGLPKSTPEMLLQSLETAISLEPTHLSAYALTIEKGTPFAKRDLILPSDEDSLKQYKLLRTQLEGVGYKQYEVSVFAKPGFQCWHNLNYWQFGSYIGLGPSAHSFWQNRRFANPRNLNLYAQAPTLVAKKALQKLALPHESLIKDFIIFGLRLRSGISLLTFQRLFNQSFTTLFSEQISKLITLKLAKLTPTRFYPTVKGLYVLDSLILEFI